MLGVSGAYFRRDVGFRFRLELALGGGAELEDCHVGVRRCRCFPGTVFHVQYMKREFNQNLSGSEVHCTACFLLVISK